MILACLTILVLDALTLFGYYAGAQGGVDQAGYLMTARLIAGETNLDNPTVTAAPTLDDASHPKASFVQRASAFDWLRNRLSFVPESPFQFASRMCVMTEPYGPADPSKPAEYRIYAKYPFGFPLLAAIARSFAGWSAMYLVNPICTALACLVAYFLFRQVVSPFMALLGMLWLACNPLVLFYANDANSHSTTLMCVVVGFWGLLSWMRTGKVWRAWIGGLALGYACTIRYSEFLLVLPVLFAAAVQFRPNRKRILGSLSLVAAWAIPVGILAIVCWISFGSPWKTGYSYCNESTGFGWKYFTGDFGDPMVRKIGNWETFIQQLNRTALFIFWAPAIVGLLAMLGSSWRLGVTILLWVLPQTILYMLYYWAPGGEVTVAYMRFFMTLMPGFILAALWGLERGLLRLPGEKRPALIVISVFAFLFLLAAAVYMYDEPLKSGTALAGQFFAAIGALFTSWQGLLLASITIMLVVGIWTLDHEKAATKVGMALAAGVLTAVGCGINLRNIIPQLESRHLQAVALRQTIDNTQKLLPPGSVLFGDDLLLNAMDCIGGWKLVNTRLFTQATFSESQRRFETTDKEQDNEDDPNPVQRQRSKFLMELLGKQLPDGKWSAKTMDELRAYQNAEIDRYFAQGRRVAFMVTGEGRLRASIDVPSRRDCEVKELGRWSPPVPVTEAIVTPAMRFGRTPPPGRGLLGRGNVPPNRLGGMGGGTVVLYELVKKEPVISPQEKALRQKAAEDREISAQEKAMRQKATEDRASGGVGGGGEKRGEAGELFPNVPAK